MSIAQSQPPATAWSAPSRRVRPPAALAPALAHLHSRIRRYIVLDALGLLILTAFAWSAFSLVLDAGVLFALFGFDYLYEGPAALVAMIRGGLFLLLLGCLGWVLFRQLLVRLLTPITPSDLAMVLERRFGAELEQRLVTAVELGDAQQAQQQGYSLDMVRETAQSAALRISQIRPGEALNRRRLARRVILAAVTLTLVLLSSILFPDVVGRWADRNLLFRDIPWPRHVLLEIIDFPGREKSVPVGSELAISVRAVKWAIKGDSSQRDATVRSEWSAQWRPMTWRHLLDVDARPWELADLPSVNELHDILPETWQGLDLDQVEARLQTPTAAHRELGIGLIRAIQRQASAEPPDRSSSERTGVSILPERLRRLPPGELLAALDAILSLDQQTAVRLAEGLLTPRPVLADLIIRLPGFSPVPCPNPAPSLWSLQRLAYDRDLAAPAFAMPATELRLLPPSWRSMPVRDLHKRLRAFATDESVEVLGTAVADRLASLFASLQQAASRKALATRKAFRMLSVPERIVLQFETVAQSGTGTRGQTGASKRAQPELKRLPGGNDFAYEFKKIDRPLRLRACAGSVCTPWHWIDVKPLPALKSLVQWNLEAGYWHRSNEPVLLGPISLAIDGESTRVLTRQGARVRLVGQCQKPLRSVRASAEPAGLVADVRHRMGHEGFTLRFTSPDSSRPAEEAGEGSGGLVDPKDAILRNDLTVRLEIEDMDGIRAVRTLAIIVDPDRPPEFLKAQFQAINRKFITSQAILPLSVAARDDGALLALEYEVTLQAGASGTPAGTAAAGTAKPAAPHQARIPFRRYFPVSVQLLEPGGLRFDQPEELTLGRVLARIPSDIAGDPLAFASTAARLPASWLTLFPPLSTHPRRDYLHEYSDPALYGPVIHIEDEFLDTLSLRSVLGKPPEKPVLDVPYRMSIRLVARDNRMREEAGKPAPWHQEGRTSESFEFNVVSEQEVLLEAGRREEDLRDRFEEAIAALVKVRAALKRMRDDLEAPPQVGNQGGTKSDDVRRAASDAADSTRALAAVRTSLDEKVLREFRQIFRELALNRVDGRVLDRLDGRICRPLAVILQPGQLFASVEQSVDTLARRLDVEGAATPKAVINDPIVQSDHLLARLDEILQDMKKLIEFNEALRVLQGLITNEQKLLDLIKAKLEDKTRKNLDDDIPETPKKPPENL